MNGFDRHGIEHLSASSLNAAAAQLPLWIMERLLKRSAPVGAAAHRGTAIEDGVVVGLLYPDKPIEECQALALEKYEMLTALSGDPNRDKERDAVSPTVKVAIDELRPYGIPDLVQERIEKPLGDGLPPLLGFADLGWSKHAITLDIKTSLRLASEISSAHARQVSGYVFGTNREGRVGYFTPPKKDPKSKACGVYVVENVSDRFAELVNIARRLEKFLSISSDPHELAAMVIPDVDHYFWSHPTAAANRREVFGL